MQPHLKITSIDMIRFSGCYVIMALRLATIYPCFLKSVVNIFCMNSIPKMASQSCFTLSVYLAYISSWNHLILMSFLARFSLSPGFTTRNSSGSTSGRVF